MKKILYLTNFYYEANGREYFREDLYITSKLKEHFHLLIAHPQQALEFLDCADLIVFRNTNPVLEYQEYFQKFLKEIKKRNILTFNSFDGKADIQGKQYLVDLTNLNYPVIPTVSTLEELPRLGISDKYIVKIKNGADSIGMEILTKKELEETDLKGKLIQPFTDFKHEVSFYYLNKEFQYALYAPNKEKRWQLEEYKATPEDLKFAKLFIEWNNIERGITRVDACRLPDGSLLLVELEDLNPYLSLDLLENEKRDKFVYNFIQVLREVE
ncbi:hypothetical protein LZ575_06330 [Antarcticibacterium sp. 1MA-6-2]|uniref:hypothetical protein n=1 Tax=Antarcticibacterium sp. 1MA-6-2 TaxID=2908210 RepID=UPI001F272588|nr:hypothetical protein [Antarcticibacterium sp. 1MA-6-2]UJH92189.1 hypothetical protein LZ575_06330 [Antarcticibacterium sp. 1MA-6-2]